LQQRCPFNGDPRPGGARANSRHRVPRASNGDATAPFSVHALRHHPGRSGGAFPDTPARADVRPGEDRPRHDRRGTSTARSACAGAYCHWERRDVDAQARLVSPTDALWMRRDLRRHNRPDGPPTTSFICSHRSCHRAVGDTLHSLPGPATVRGRARARGGLHPRCQRGRIFTSFQYHYLRAGRWPNDPWSGNSLAHWTWPPRQDLRPYQSLRHTNAYRTAS